MSSELYVGLMSGTSLDGADAVLADLSGTKPRLLAHSHVSFDVGLKRELLALNREGSEPRVEVVLLSRNSADTGLRVFNSIQHFGLPISRAVFTSGQTPYRYVKPFGAHLFLSADQDDVRMALRESVAAATSAESVMRTPWWTS